MATATNTIDGTVTYTSDSTGQLPARRATSRPCRNLLLRRQRQPRTNAGYATGPNNELLSDGTYTYSYDTEGNRISRTRTSRDQPADDTDPLHLGQPQPADLGDVQEQRRRHATKTVTYLYDVFDRWIGETIDVPGQDDAADAVRLRRQPDRFAVRQDGHGQPGRSATFAPLPLEPAGGGPAFRRRAGHVAEATAGSVGLAAGPTTREHDPRPGDVQFRHRRDDRREPSGVQCLWRCWRARRTPRWIACSATPAGRSTRPPASSTMAMGGRWYESITGRWLKRRPGGLGPDMNLYRYCGNGPTTGVDPTGMATSYNPTSYNPWNPDFVLWIALWAELATSYRRRPWRSRSSGASRPPHAIDALAHAAGSEIPIGPGIEVVFGSPKMARWPDGRDQGPGPAGGSGPEQFYCGPEGPDRAASYRR